MTNGSGVAVDPTNGDVYVADSSEDDVVIFTSPLLPDVSSGEATGLSVEGSATLNGTVDFQMGETVTSCEFEYGTESSYGELRYVSCLPQAPGRSP